MTGRELDMGEGHPLGVKGDLGTRCRRDCLEDLERAWGSREVESRLGLGDEAVTAGEVRSEEHIRGAEAGRP